MTQHITLSNAKGDRVELETFVKFLEAKFLEEDTAHHPILCEEGPYETVSAEVGRKYIRIVAKKRDSQAGEYFHEGQRHVYCFLDFEGNIYKSDSWKKPAKYVRGSVFDPNYSWGKSLDRYGSLMYLR